MSPSKKGVIFQLAEETAYSSKGHFKTADWMDTTTKLYIFIPLVTSALSAFFVLPNLWLKIISFLGFVFSTLALISVWSDRTKCNEFISKHMELANKYLKVHKEIRNYVLQGNQVTNEDIQTFQKTISELDQESSLYRISFAGRIWSKFRIRKEMDLDWIYN